MILMPVAMAERQYPFPSRTRKSSSPAPMIVGFPAKVGGRRLFFVLILETGISEKLRHLEVPVRHSDTGALLALAAGRGRRRRIA